jgi:two-component system, OmpR family, copper resistance phosphate regulon response regulator CusR
MAAILVAENDFRISSVIRKALVAQGYSVRVVVDGASAFSYARSGNFDMMLIASGLPCIEGSEVRRRLRTEGIALPVVTLTDRAHGAGQDCLAVPFRTGELLETVHSHLNPVRQRPALSYGSLRLDPGTRRAQVGDYVVDLSERECALAETFLRHPGQVLSREDLWRQAWGCDGEPGSNIVDVYVRYLRRKLGADWFVALKGIGYRLEAAR